MTRGTPRCLTRPLGIFSIASPKRPSCPANRIDAGRRTARRRRLGVACCSLERKDPLSKNEAGTRGYRFAGTQGGASAFGGREAVVIVALDPEGRRFRYILLATNRNGTMQSEMNEAPPEFNFAGMTVFSSTFGGRPSTSGVARARCCRTRDHARALRSGLRSAARDTQRRRSARRSRSVRNRCSRLSEIGLRTADATRGPNTP